MRRHRLPASRNRDPPIASIRSTNWSSSPHGWRARAAHGSAPQPSGRCSSLSLLSSLIHATVVAPIVKPHPMRPVASTAAVVPSQSPNASMPPMTAAPVAMPTSDAQRRLPLSEPFPTWLSFADLQYVDSLGELPDALWAAAELDYVCVAPLDGNGSASLIAGQIPREWLPGRVAPDVAGLAHRKAPPHQPGCCLP
jgi:hypothetical protein